MNGKKAAILIKRAALEFDKLSNPFFAEYDLTASQYKILKFLYAQPERTARVVELERQYSMTHPTALGLLEQLEKKGWVRRVPNPADGRGKLIALTDRADGMQRELEALGDRVEALLTEPLTSREKEQLIRLLEKLLDRKQERSDHDR